MFIVSSNSNFHLNVSRRCCAIHIYRSTRNSNFGSLRRLVRFYLVNARIYRNFVLLFQTITHWYPNVNRTNKLFKLCKNFRNKNFFERTRVSIQRSVHRGDSTPDKSRSCFGHLRLLNRCWSKIAEARVALDSTFSTVPRDIHI